MHDSLTRSKSGDDLLPNNSSGFESLCDFRNLVLMSEVEPTLDGLRRSVLALGGCSSESFEDVEAAAFVFDVVA